MLFKGTPTGIGGNFRDLRSDSSDVGLRSFRPSGFLVETNGLNGKSTWVARLCLEGTPLFCGFKGKHRSQALFGVL